MSRVSIETSLASMYGSEPTFDYTNVADVDYHNAKAFDWFNANLPSSKKRECLVAYAKATKQSEETIAAVSALDLSDILFCNAIYAKMIATGAKLNPVRREAFETAFAAYVQLGAAKVRAAGPVTVNVQTFVQDRLMEYSAEINYVIDSFMTGGFKSNFDPSEWVASNGVKGIYCDKIIENILNPIFVELASVVEGTNMDLVEGWSHITVAQAKSLAKFVWTIMEAFRGRAEKAKAERSPRIRKPKPPAKQVKNLKYKGADSEWGITSIDPKKIVGATELYLFNTKTRALICVFADDAKGFGVKGSTLLGMDEKKTYSKTLRKPKETLPVVVKDGKRAIAKEMDTIKAVSKPFTGRINKDMVIVRVF